MIPRLGDGNVTITDTDINFSISLENDSPSRGRKLFLIDIKSHYCNKRSLENDSPSRGRKRPNEEDGKDYYFDDMFRK